MKTYPDGIMKLHSAIRARLTKRNPAFDVRKNQTRLMSVDMLVVGWVISPVRHAQISFITRWDYQTKKDYWLIDVMVWYRQRPDRLGWPGKPGQPLLMRPWLAM